MDDATAGSILTRNQFEFNHAYTAISANSENYISGKVIVYFSTQEKYLAFREAELMQNPNSAITSLMCCGTLDSLLTYLESDSVQKIVFDASISKEEVNLVKGWARIFNPEIECQTIVNPKIPHKLHSKYRVA